MTRQLPPSRVQTPALLGDEDKLFRLHHDRLIRDLQGRLRVTRELAEDAMSRAWIQLFRHQPERDQIVGWLYTVAKHEAFALLRRSHRERPNDEIEDSPHDLDLDDALEARRALRLLGRLKPQQRLVLLLRAEGHSYRSIQRLTGSSYTWVNRHLTEGRRALRELLQQGDE